MTSQRKHSWLTTIFLGHDLFNNITMKEKSYSVTSYLFGLTLLALGHLFVIFGHNKSCPRKEVVNQECFLCDVIMPWINPFYFQT